MVNVQGLKCAVLTLIAALLTAIGLLVYGGSRDDCPGYMLVAAMAPIIVGIVWLFIVMLTGFRTSDGTSGQRAFNIAVIAVVAVVVITFYIAGGIMHNECVGKCLLVAASVVVGMTVLVVVVMLFIAWQILRNDDQK